MLGEKQFISLLEKLDEGVIITSSEYDIMYANEIATAYFGEKIVGKPIYNLIRNSEVIDAINESQEINISFRTRRVSGSTIYNFTIIKNMKIQELLLSMTVQRKRNFKI